MSLEQLPEDYFYKNNKPPKPVEYTDDLRYLEFEVFDENTLVATVFVDTQEGIVKVEQFTDLIPLRPFNMEPITIPNVIDFLESRCFPRTRANADQLLKDLGVSIYDPIAITKRTHGLQLEDYMWVRYKGDTTTYDQIKLRD